MANQAQLAILQQGVEVWNPWRARNTNLKADLSGARLEGVDLRGADLTHADLRGAHLEGAHLSKAALNKSDLGGAHLEGAHLEGADLRAATLRGAWLSLADLGGAHLEGADLRAASLTGANLSRANLSEAQLEWAHLNRANLSRAHLEGAHLSEAHLSDANLHAAELREADLRQTDLRGADLSEANLSLATLSQLHLEGVDLRGADLTHADLRGAHLSRACLNKANLSEAVLNKADLSEANLSEANLCYAALVRTCFEGAILANCAIFGISAWGLQLDGATQANLSISDVDEPTITVDNLELAQFLYLMLHNQKIRGVIDTLTSKVVLILGRFTPERKAVLDALREELRKRNYVPVLFDFEGPESHDFTETVTLLARMARFVIADLTEPSSIPQELQAIVPDVAVPVQPLIAAGAKPFAMFVDHRKYHWMLDVYRYPNLDELLATMQEKVIAPAEAKVAELRAAR